MVYEKEETFITCVNFNAQKSKCMHMHLLMLHVNRPQLPIISYYLMQAVEYTAVLCRLPVACPASPALKNKRYDSLSGNPK